VSLPAVGFPRGASDEETGGREYTIRDHIVRFGLNYRFN
jgi:hypothetical protein